MSNGKGGNRRPGENRQAFDDGWEVWQAAKRSLIKAEREAKAAKEKEKKQ